LETRDLFSAHESEVAGTSLLKKSIDKEDQDRDGQAHRHKKYDYS